jgi:sulfatase maturation enzyme AslB (radical SAM superfamily)
MRKKSRRIVISTNGYLTDQIIALVKKYPDIGIRVSLEGLAAANDELRGMKDGFDHGLRTLLKLQHLGLKDIGFGITVSDRNYKDMLELYQLAKKLGFEFATAAVHNSYFFKKDDHKFKEPEEAISAFQLLINELLSTNRIKNWYRAYFNYGLINYIKGRKRLLPCEAGSENFFVLPNGDIAPCNGSDEPMIMGNIRSQTWEQIWNGPEAEKIRKSVQNCPKNCWMVGSAAPVIKKYPLAPTKWVIKNKIKKSLGKEICVD